MYIDDNIMTFEESLIFKLRALYEVNNFTRYKVNKFEEYDLYALNKDYLVSDNVISFTDTNGKLMALKPDVTLSLVRNYPIPSDSIARLYYNENVYRVSKSTGVFSEIMQVGIECLGAVDTACVADTLVLAAQSLAAISNQTMLSITNLDIVCEAIAGLDISAAAQAAIMKFMSEKNFHALEEFCSAAGANPQALARFMQLVTFAGSTQELLAWLETQDFAEASASALSQVVAALELQGALENVRIDFSLASDLAYYNGIAFKGYVAGIPSAVLSGGQYDKLMTKMNKSQKAIGFAVYTDSLAYNMSKTQGGE